LGNGIVEIYSDKAILNRLFVEIVFKAIQAVSNIKLKTTALSSILNG
jgi:hypothetical protein